MSIQTTFKSVVRPTTKVINTILPGTALDFTGRATNLNFTANQLSTFDSITGGEHLIDGQSVIIMNNGTSSINIASALMINSAPYDIEAGMTAVFIFIAASGKFFDAGGSATSIDIQENLDVTNSNLSTLTSNFNAHIHNGTDAPKVHVADLHTDGVSTPLHVLALNGSGVPVFQDVKTYIQATARYSNTDTTTNLGASSSWTEVPIMGSMERRDNTSYFVPVGDGIQVNWTGRLKVRAHVIATSATQNSQLDIALKKNTAVQPRIASAFIRVSSGAAEATCYISDEIDVVPGDIITIVSRQGGATGSITFFSANSSYLELEIPPAVFAKGDQGADGNPNWSFLTNNGVPSSLNGVDYDVYLNKDNGDLYRKQSGAWVFQLNIKGAVGDPGVSKMLLWAERLGSLTNNSEEWSYGASSPTGAGRGIVQMAAGKITHLSLECATPGTGVTTVEVMKNGTSTGQSITLAETIAKGYVALGTPVSYVVGDTIGFRTVLGGSAANARMTALLIEDGVVVTPPAFVAPIPWKHVKVLGSTDVTNGYVDLPHLAIGNTIVAATGRLCIHENQDYTVSNSGGVSRITFVNDLASAGEEAAASGDTFYFTYQY